MGIYECLYDCNDGGADMCVSCTSTLGPECDTSFMRICSKHQIKVGAKFQYNINLTNPFFMRLLKPKRPDEFGMYSLELEQQQQECNYTHDIEVVDFAKCEKGGRGFTLAKLRILSGTLDTSVFDETKKIWYSQLDDAPAWEIASNGDIFIVVQFNNNCILRKQYKGNKYCWNWGGFIEYTDMPQGLSAVERLQWRPPA